MPAPILLRDRLRLAALHALATAFAAPGLIACGGSIDTTFADAGADDAAAPVDGSTPHDAAPTPDARQDRDGDAPDAATCPLPSSPSQICDSVPSACLPDGWVVGANDGLACAKFCTGQASGGGFSGCNVTADPGGGYQINCQCLGMGRFPAGLELDATPAGGDSLGAFLARSAALEATAVRAFEQLAREVAAHGAPTELVKRLRNAAKDEIRHARVLGREAKRRGAKIPRIRATGAPRQARSLLAIARENAVEGCGREAIGGALLHVQAARAEDPQLRAALLSIADDECGHAELSADLAAWFASRLGAAERVAVDEARRAFFAECAAAPPAEAPAVRRALGIPDARTWESLVAEVQAAMLAAAA